MRGEIKFCGFLTETRNSSSISFLLPPTLPPWPTEPAWQFSEVWETTTTKKISEMKKLQKREDVAKRGEEKVADAKWEMGRKDPF